MSPQQYLDTLVFVIRNRCTTGFYETDWEMITYKTIKEKQHNVKGNSVPSSKSLFDHCFLVQSYILTWNKKTEKQAGIFADSHLLWMLQNT